MSTSPAAADPQAQQPQAETEAQTQLQSRATVTSARTAADALPGAATSAPAPDPAQAAAVPDPDPDPAPEGVAGGRARIDALDAELIELIRRRVAVSAEIQSARLSTGGRRLDLRRETEVIGRYTQALGRPGTSVAMALLELGRGRV